MKWTQVQQSNKYSIVWIILFFEKATGRNLSMRGMSNDVTGAFCSYSGALLQLFGQFSVTVISSQRFETQEKTRSNLQD